MEIREVKTIEEARICDELLTLLIRDESKYNKAIDENFTVNNYFENIYFNKNNNLLIALINDEIVGYVFAKEIENDETIKSVLIDGLFVKEEYRNQGIASALIENIVKVIKEKGITAIKIKVMSNNTNAIHLYQKYGFEELSKEMINYI